jgi:hypothetical protein
MVTLPPTDNELTIFAFVLTFKVCAVKVEFTRAFPPTHNVLRFVIPPTVKLPLIISDPVKFWFVAYILVKYAELFAKKGPFKTVVPPTVKLPGIFSV